MTYQEIQDRLSKCESTLEQLKKGSVKPTEKITVRNLEILKESLQKQLTEADKGIVYTDDEAKAKDLADKGANVKLTSEMKPGDEEDMERRRLSRLSTKDQNTLIAIKAMMDKEKATNEAPDGPSIDKMSRAQCIDFLNTSPDKVNHMSDEELRDACKDKNADLRENLDTSEAVDPSITDLLVQFVSLMGMGYGAYAAAKKLSDKHGDIDLDSIKAALSKKEETDDKVKDGADTDYAKRRKKESDYHQDKDYYKEDKEKDDYGRNHYPEKGEYIKLSDEEVEEMKNPGYSSSSQKNQYANRVSRPTKFGNSPELDKELDDFHKRQKDLDARLGLKEEEDVDVGHQDDEPDMLKSSAMETATYAAKLYKKLHKYDNFDGEVDFPHWWQKKLILARDYLSAAFHYLDSEEKQPIIDKLALENVSENEIGDADKDIGMGYKNARLVIAYIRDKFYPHMNDEELDEFNDEMIFHFKQEVDAIKSFKSPVNRGVTEEDDNPVPQGKHITVDDMQFMHDSIVSRMKQLAKVYKKKGPEATIMLGPNNDREEKVVDILKILTKKKRELEDALQNKVSGIGQDQELDEIAFKDIPCPACGDPECDHKADHL